MANCVVIIKIPVLNKETGEVENKEITFDMSKIEGFPNITVTSKEVAKAIFNDPELKLQLMEYSKLQMQRSAISVNEFLSDKGGVVPNATLSEIIDKYPEFATLSGKVDETTPLLLAQQINYFGNKIKDSSVRVFSKTAGTVQETFVLNPDNVKARKNLADYLNLKNYFQGNKEELGKLIWEEYGLNYEKIKEAFTRIKIAPNLTIEQKTFPNSLENALLDYISNKAKYKDIPIESPKGFIFLSSIFDELTNHVLKSMPITEYRDHTIRSMNLISDTKRYGVWGKWLSTDNVYELVKLKRINLKNRINALKEALKDTIDITLQVQQKGQIQLLEQQLQQFTGINAKSSIVVMKGALEEIFKMTEDDVLYKTRIQDKYILVTHTGKTLADRYSDFDYNTVTLMSPNSEYRGYNIYQDPKGNYYVSRHILTTKSYGKRYTSIQSAKEYIDKQHKFNAIVSDSLEGFHKLNENEYTVISPRSYTDGQVIRVLEYKTPTTTLLTDPELELLHSKFYVYDGIQQTASLELAKKAYIDLFDVGANASEENKKELINFKEQLSKALVNLDTAEKFMAFVYSFRAAAYKLNDVTSTSIFKVDFNGIINDINKSGYKYYVVESVKRKTNKRTYFYNATDETSKVVYEVNINPITNKLKSAKIDMTDSRPTPTLRSLRDFAELINKDLKERFGFKEDVIQLGSTQELSGIIKQLINVSESLNPAELKSFIYNNKIYINTSVATNATLFAEYSSIYLMAIKAMNTKAYQDMLNTFVPDTNLSIYGTKSAEEVLQAKENILASYLTDHLLNYRRFTDNPLTEPKMEQFKRFIKYFNSKYKNSDLDPFSEASISKTNIPVFLAKMFGPNYDFNATGFELTLEDSPQLYQEFKKKALEDGAEINEKCD